MFKILFVDDVKINLDIVTRALKKYGYEVYTAKDGAQSIELAKQVVPDLIIMDLKMDEVSGVQAANAIRSEKTTNHIPIIACSAFLDEQGENMEVFSDKISKPIKAKALRSKIESWFFDGFEQSS